MIREIRSTFALIAAMTLGSSFASAQENVDIGLFQNGSRLEVRLRPTHDFDGLVSALVFTLRWDRATNAHLGDQQQKSAAGTYIPIAPSGPVHEDGPFDYQIYAGFGFDELNSTGETWKAGKEYVIATIPFNGEAQFSLVNDSWTAGDLNNGNYYISLGGHDRTGVIYKGLAASNGSPSVSISPNPNRGIFTVAIPLNAGERMTMEIVNTSGQVVFQDAPNQLEGMYRREMDFTDVGAGNYNLRVIRDGVNTENYKIIVE